MSDSGISVAEAPARTRLPRWAYIVTAAGIVVALVVGGISIGRLLPLDDPMRSLARQYMSDVVSGHVQAALRLDGTTVTGKDLLLTDAAYRGAADRVTGYFIASESVHGTTAKLSVRTFQPSGTATTALDFIQTKGTWHLRPVALDAIAVTTGMPSDATATFGGARLTGTSLPATLRSFPGAYRLSQLSSQDFYSLSAPIMTLTGFGSHRQLDVSATLTDRGREDIEIAASAWVDRCAAEGAASAVRCPFGLNVNDRSGYQDSRWSYSTAPTYTVAPWGAPCLTAETVGACWSVQSNDFIVTFSGDKADGTYTTDPFTAQVVGAVRGFNASGAVFLDDGPLGAYGS